MLLRTLTGHPTLKVLEFSLMFEEFVPEHRLLEVGILLGRMATVPSALKRLTIDGDQYDIGILHPQ